jgi:hypothetical protein
MKMAELGAEIEQVRLPRDRNTGILIMFIWGVIRGFAFIKFISTEHAKQFFERNGNAVYFGENKSRLDFTFNDDGEWICSVVRIIIIDISVPVSITRAELSATNAEFLNLVP